MTALSALPPLLTAAGALLLLLAALHDVAARTIPNTAALLLAAIGLALRGLDGQLLAALLAATAVFAVAACCWQRGWFGGGDVKLLAAASLLVPPGQVPSLVLGMALAGGVLSVLYLALMALVPAPAAMRPARRPMGRLARILRAEQWRIARRGPLPYGTAIAAGAFLVLLRFPL